MVASNYDESLGENLIEPKLPGLPDIRTRLVKAVALYGPNAGGKTNLLMALRFLRWLVVDSATGQKPEAKLLAEPFRLDHESSKEPTIFEIVFIADQVRYELAIALDRDRVTEERLVAYPHGRSQLWYDRVWDHEEQRYNWAPDQQNDFRLDPGIIEKTRENTLFLTTAAQWNNSQVMPIYEWFTAAFKFIDLQQRNLSHEFTSQLIKINKNYENFIANTMRCADLGLSSIEIVEKKLEPDQQLLRIFGAIKDIIKDVPIPDVFDRQIWEVTFQHEGRSGKNFAMEWLNESAGTRRLFSLLGPWIAAAENNQILIIDEIEASLHPNIAVELLRLLFNLTGKARSQLLFTTHNPFLLDTKVLRRDQIWFVDKNREGESYLYPLTDYKPRADESVVRGYLAGRYGAVPFIPRGLMAGEEPAREENQNAS